MAERVSCPREEESSSAATILRWNSIPSTTETMVYHFDADRDSRQSLPADRRRTGPKFNNWRAHQLSSSNTHIGLAAAVPLQDDAERDPEPS